MPNLFGQPLQNPVLQQQQNDPRLALAQSLIQAGALARPVNSPWEGVARLGSGLAGALIARNAGREYKERGEKYNATLAQALQASQPWKAPDNIMSAPPDTLAAGSGPMPERPAYDASVVVPRGQDAPGTGGIGALIAALSGNPDTAGLGLQFGMRDMERRQTRADKREDTIFERDTRIAGIPLEDAAKLPGAKNLATMQGEISLANELAKAEQVGPINTRNAVNQATALSPITTQTAVNTAAGTARVQEPYDMRKIDRQAAATASNRDPRGPAGDYAGNSMEAQDANILLRGDPASPLYAGAYNRQAQEKATFDPDTGKTVLIRPDMSAYRRPTFRSDGVPGPQGAQQPAPGTSAPPPLTGGPPPIPGPYGDAGGVTIKQVAEPKVSFNENQGKAAGFADRMAKSGPIVNQNEVAGTSRVNRTAGAVPVIGNSLVSKEYQNFEQAKQDWLIAQLRRESGAAIGDPEYLRTEKQYFPVPGDDESTIKQKRELRDVAAAAMRREAGASYKAPAGATRARARNPQTGAEVELDPDTNTWVPVK